MRLHNSCPTRFRGGQGNLLTRNQKQALEIVRGEAQRLVSALEALQVQDADDQAAWAALCVLDYAFYKGRSRDWTLVTLKRRKPAFPPLAVVAGYL